MKIDRFIIAALFAVLLLPFVAGVASGQEPTPYNNTTVTTATTTTTTTSTTSTSTSTTTTTPGETTTTAPGETTTTGPDITVLDDPPETNPGETTTSVTVIPDDNQRPTTGSLPVTGGDILGFVVFGLGAVLVGAMFVRAGRSAD